MISKSVTFSKHLQNKIRDLIQDARNFSPACPHLKWVIF